MRERRPMFKTILCCMLFSSLLFSQEWQHYTQANSGLPDDQVNAIFVSLDGLIWLGTQEGLGVYNTHAWRQFTESDGLSDNAIHDISYQSGDSAYSLWIASDSGLTRLEVHSFEDIRIAETKTSANSGLLSDRVFCAAADTAEFHWFGTDRGVSLLADTAWIDITLDFLKDSLINDIAADTNGLMHIATENGGLSRLKYNEVDGITSASTMIRPWSALPPRVYTVYIDSNNDQWFGTDEGVFKHIGLEHTSNWSLLSTTEGLVDNTVTSIETDGRGGLWFGTPRGVSFYSKETFENFTVSEGLISNTINDIAIDMPGNAWIATDGGVSVYKRPTSVDNHRPLTHALSLTNYPNPFNAGTSIRFELQEPERIHLAIYNLAGERLITLADRYQQAGSQRIYWSGTDSEGFPLPSGVYFAVLTGKGLKLSQKLMLLK
ncbi:T9SS type A sorting domain-containing protein [candidate division KSB1 bacterium]|nr:T9SS type A sorting domain-containing protein [candidate division KSB1 bacterium]